MKKFSLLLVFAICFLSSCSNDEALPADNSANASQETAGPVNEAPGNNDNGANSIPEEPTNPEEPATPEEPVKPENPGNENYSLSGEWNLVDVRGGIGNMIFSYEEGLITWKFDETSGTLTVKNDNTAEGWDMYDSGSYIYSFVSNEYSPEDCAEALKISVNDYEPMGCIQFVSENEVIIHQIGADVVRITLKR